jgi:hypothetical protein
MLTLNQQISNIRNDLEQLKINTTDFSGGIMEYTISTISSLDDTVDDIIHQLDNIANSDGLSGELLRINEAILSLSGSIDRISFSSDISFNSLQVLENLIVDGSFIINDNTISITKINGLNTILDHKQELLTAGDNITIDENNIISANVLQGATGPQGIQGETGPAGADGLQGPQGLQGETGPAGADGLQGPQGLQGETGPAGADGLQGPQGLQGETGLAGADGLQGPQGLQGETGLAGADGLQGPQGLQGETGPAGADGIQGPQGLQGETGLAGADGLQGIQGLQGETGPAGADGLQGAQGLQGETGPAGADGLQGPQGIQGETGPAGADGPQGAQGLQGETGPQGDSADTTYVDNLIATKQDFITDLSANGFLSAGYNINFDICGSNITINSTGSGTGHVTIEDVTNLQSTLDTKQDTITNSSDISLNSLEVLGNLIVDISKIEGLNALLETKQNVLTPGTNITIVGNTISATGDVTINDLSVNSLTITSEPSDASHATTKSYVDASLNLKQNILTPGNNITIIDDVISSLGGSGGSGIFNLSGNIYYYDSTPLGIGTSNVNTDYALTISGGLYLTGDETTYLNSDLYWLKDTSNNIYIEDINTFGLGTSYIDLSFANKLDVCGNVLFRNNLNVNETITCNQLNLNGIDMYNKILDLSDSATNAISSTGTTVNTSYKIYDKFVTTNIGNWIPIDNNVDTGFVASFIPTSANSKILIQCTLHVSVANGTDSRWWGAKLYRKIGSSDWAEVVGATNNNTVSRPAGTGCFITSHHQAGQDTFIQNLGNSYVDEALDNTNLHSYTIYWKCRIGNNDNGKIINLNRPHSSTDAFRSLPVSSIIIQEIYYP